ncbi:hypothetical protein ASD46_21720 [Rhizobium sp. Root491]|uniref:hypothetical protein n=1 Tax=Rhizobium sp. Root491 TaxID=1736548 RepID=UPI00071509C2|nr:hypothetical protein [Rhizobium sp. Root491]KQY51385.1 hypothetical protein ASD46_21720 [Rhizobium sp. Root491]
MEFLDLRAIGAVLSALGSVLLAIRVRNIIKALSEVLKIHDENFKNMHGNTIVIAVNSSKWVDKAQGSWLLIIGFGLLAIGATLQAIGVWRNLP